MSKRLHSFWQNMTPWHGLLYPFMWCFQGITALRKRWQVFFNRQAFDVPIIVVGNLTTGGVGKTPLVIALIEACQARGIRVGVVSRGYKAACQDFPHEVRGTDTAQMVGDEPFLIAKKTGVPVIIAPDRVAAVEYLLKHHAPQLIISDDGLQHYRMPRAIEIVVLDGVRLLGNQRLLPVGPLREPVARLKSVDFTIVNSGFWPNAYSMTLQPGAPMSLKNNQCVVLSEIPSPIAAIAGIGHPERFFQTLTSLSLSFEPHVFPDHHAFSSKDFKKITKPILMTEKDAVKCQPFATDMMYFLPVKALVEESFWDALWAHPALKNLF